MKKNYDLVSLQCCYVEAKAAAQSEVEAIQESSSVSNNCRRQVGKEGSLMSRTVIELHFQLTQWISTPPLVGEGMSGEAKIRV